ncbi:MAG: TonB-dependent receptor [Bacteroidales bacterium]|nr:TonB-dependent receptor [Bacteroidales bacterium]
MNRLIPVCRKFLLALAILVPFGLAAQQAGPSVSLSISDGTVMDCINAIERQTGYTFIFNNNIDIGAKASCNVRSESLENVLSAVFAPIGINWAISGKQIVLTPTESDNGQPRSADGVIKDSRGDPIPGVAVLGGSSVVMSNIDGAYSVQLKPGKGAALTFSCLGYAEKTLPVPASGRLDVVLEDDIQALDEAVVVGYGVQKKVNLTGAISVVDEDAIQNRPQASLAHILQGSVPGLNITTSSGRPGSDASVNIRGTNSINGGNPLVIIDGAEGSMSTVNPNDVESISIIKDASAAVYGARASFGVILITTKSGRNSDGKSTVRYSGRAGWSSPTASTDFETRGYYSVYVNELLYKATLGVGRTNYTSADMDELWARRNDKVPHPDRPWVVLAERDGRESYLYYANTDWYHEIFRDYAPATNHNVSVTGGTERMRYFISGGMDYQEGIIKKSSDYNRRFNIRSKLDLDVNKWLKLSNNTTFYAAQYFYPGPEAVSTIFSYMTVGGYASYPAHNPDGSSLYNTSFSGQPIFDGLMTALDKDKHRNIDNKRNIANTIEATITPFKQLEVKANYSYIYNTGYNSNRSVNTTYSTYPGEILVANSGKYDNYLKETNSSYDHHQTNLYATYTDSFAEAHNVKLTLGANYETRRSKSVNSVGYNLLSDDLSDLNLMGQGEDGEERMTLSGGQNAYSLLGFFGRANYDWKGRYLLELSGRYDGTSRFAKGHRWGFFPSASIGWRVSEEPFFNPLKSWWDNFKIRFSYGSLGNQQVGYYDYLRVVSIGNQNYLFGGNTKPTTATISAPNASDLTWETTIHKNLGMDFSFLKGRLSFTAEGYIRDTKDMLAAGLAIPAVYGAAAPKTNCADLRTKGIEFQLGWKDDFNLLGKPFSYSATVSLSDYKSKITKFNNPEKSFAKTYYEGMTIGEIWGYKTDGLFWSDLEAQMYPVDQTYVNSTIIASPGSENGLHGGDLKYLDLDGDGVISIGQNTVNDPGDRCIIGNSQPRWLYGLNLGFNWMGFDFSVFFQGVGHQDWYPASNAMLFWGPYARPYATFIPKDFHRMYWTEDHKDAYFPRPRGYTALNANSELTSVNDRYLQNVAYCRLKNLTVGYTLPKKWLDAIKMQTLRVYFTGDNLAYWAPGLYSHYVDPEQAINGGNLRVYSWMKTFMFGIDITF